MRVNYGLRRWAGFMKYKNILDERSRTEAGQFFRGLQRLEQDEVRLLHEKYVTGDWVTFDSWLGVYFNNKPLSDAVLAERRNIKIKDYRLKRSGIEKKLQRFLVEEWCTSDEKEKQALEEFHLVVGTNLYLKRYEVSRYFPDDVKAIEVTPDEEKAKTCTATDEEKLRFYGFERRRLPRPFNFAMK